MRIRSNLSKRNNKEVPMKQKFHINGYSFIVDTSTIYVLYVVLTPTAEIICPEVVHVDSEEEAAECVER
jgi:hypothetical protein